LARDLSERPIPLKGTDARVGVLVSGLDPELADCNNVAVTIGDNRSLPLYVGAVTGRHGDSIVQAAESALDHLTLVEIDVPSELSPGKALIRIEWEGAASEPFQVEFVRAEAAGPKIVTIRNGIDYGTDVHSRGPKSLLNLYVDGLDEKASRETVFLEVEGKKLIPDFVGFVSENGTWQVNVQLPPDVTAWCSNPASLLRGRASSPVSIQILE
jgi:hypothetical protein